ncbi:uncharacterized protein LOC127450754 isoform X2 [Myxocyprinus asiaticus]|uniref:uncharacterized protein LOC127450754 isoform X2 n=1 Tax=Myxocyprinus asiaticus TaxID=70543 RepID=UPI00222365EA|nr:uncharacterized protein LOC127450754 isoform X2 [Myxocyprinus asiaticus]
MGVWCERLFLSFTQHFINLQCNRGAANSTLSAAASDTNRANMQNAETVSATITTNRNCTVEITNVTTAYCLINPKVYMFSGFSCHPPQPTIRTTRTEVCSFTKDDNTATGAVGLLTYDLFQMKNRMCTERVAVLFSVPFDYHLNKNVLGIGMFESSRGCDKALYKHMYEGKDFSQFTRVEAAGSGIVHKGQNIDLRATMSNVGKAIIKLELYDKMGQ